MKRCIIYILFIFSFILTAFTNNSDDEELATVVLVTDSQNLEATFTSIKVEGKITADGGSPVISRGICWSTSPNPTINDNLTTENTDIFISNITNLVANTTYYFRVYVTNGLGTNYSREEALTTSSFVDTTWKFYLIHDSNNTWHANVIFYTNGTTKYDEPSELGLYTTYGTWTLKGNILSYDFDSSDTDNTSYQFTGTLQNNTMTGTYTWGSMPVKHWTAINY